MQLSTDRISEAFYRNHDAYSTTNALIYVIVAMVAACLAFFNYFLSNRATEEYSMSGDLLTGPILGISVTGIIVLVLLWIFWHRQADLNSFVYLPIIGLAITLIVVFALGHGKMDLWKADMQPIGTDTGKAATFMYWSLTILSFVGVVYAYMRGTLRTDRLMPVSPAFFSFLLTALALGTFFTYIMALIYKTLDKQETISFGGKTALYFTGGFVLFGGFVLSNIAAGYLIPWLTRQNLIYSGGAVDRGAYMSTMRTKQMTQAAIASVIIIPTVLVYIYRDSMVFSSKDHSSEWTRLVIAVLTGIPLVCILAMIALEFHMLFPNIFSLVSAILVAGGILVVGLGMIPWTPVTVAGAGLLLIMLMFTYLVSMRNLPRLTISLMIAFSFMVTKFVSRAVLLKIEDDSGTKASDGIRFLLMGAPILVFTGLWFFRSWYTGSGYSIPILFFLFSIFYIFAFFGTASDPNTNLFLPGEDQWTNIGVDFTIVLSLIVLFSSLGGFTKEGADYYQKEVSSNTPLAVNIALYMVYTVLSYAAALVYYNFQANVKFRDLVGDLQRKSKETLGLAERDINKATDWKDLFGQK